MAIQASTYFPGNMRQETLLSQAFKEATTEGTQWSLLSGILGGMCYRRYSLVTLSLVYSRKHQPRFTGTGAGGPICEGQKPRSFQAEIWRETSQEDTTGPGTHIQKMETLPLVLGGSEALKEQSGR